MKENETRKETKMNEVRCHFRVNQGHWCQEHYETASRDAGRRARGLRKAGYDVRVSSLGPQVTEVGVIKMTMVDIRPGANADTFGIPRVEVESL